MPYELDLPIAVAAKGWKVKIQEKERLEPPHVTIIFKTEHWRYGLRTPGFLDAKPDPRQVPPAVIRAIDAALADLTAQWDRMYPSNPV